MLPLDEMLNRTLFDLRLMERALHESGSWEAKWGGMKVPLLLETTGSGVLFTGIFQDFCLIGTPENSVEVLHRGQSVCWKEIDFPGDGGFMFSWMLNCSQIRESV